MECVITAVPTSLYNLADF